jgi:prophage antirepressor-like protein
VHKTHTLGGLQEVAIINESGLYSLIFSSNKAAAKVFKKWITSVVIPSIRQHGGCINGQEGLAQEEQAQTLQVIQDEAQRLRARFVEERDARSDAHRFMSRGRKRRRAPRPPKPSAAPRNG